MSDDFEAWVMNQAGIERAEVGALYTHDADNSVVQVRALIYRNSPSYVYMDVAECGDESWQNSLANTTMRPGEARELAASLLLAADHADGVLR